MALIACFSPAANALNCTALPLCCQSGHPHTRLRSPPPPSQKSPSAHFNLRRLLLRRAKRLGCCLLDSFCSAFPRRRFPPRSFGSFRPTLLLFWLGSDIIGSDPVGFQCTSARRLQLIQGKEFGKMERDIRYHFTTPPKIKINKCA